MGLNIITGKKSSNEKQYKKCGIIVETGEPTIHSGNIVLGKKIGTADTTTEPLNTPQPPLKAKRKPPSADVIPIQKGQKLSLDQDLYKMQVCMGWEAPGSNYDLDISVFMVDSNNHTEEENFIFYNNPQSACRGVILDTNNSLQDDAAVAVDLHKIPDKIQKLAFTITIDEAEERKQNFSQIRDIYFCVVENSANKEKIRYTIQDSFSMETAIVVAEIYRYKGIWKITAIGSGFHGGLGALCKNYGIEVM